MFRRVQFINFLLVLMISEGFISYFEWFINVWIGSKFNLPMTTVMLIVTSFYLMNYNITSWGFNSALGLAQYLKKVSIAEMSLNLFFSIFLGHFCSMGLNGIILGTILSTITTVGWMNAYIIFNFGIKKSPRLFYKTWLVNFAIFGGTLLLALYLKKIVLVKVTSFVESSFVFSALLIVTAVLVSVAYLNTIELRFFRQILFSRILKFKIRKKL